ncbi:MAG: ABC transporter permease [Deinococcota bacterium]|nr:ABC transporter permease [Deinococcota bacterium]
MSLSLTQDPELDPDWALIGPLGPRLEEDGPYPLHIFVRFFSASEAARLTPELRAWTWRVFGPVGVAQPIDSLLAERSDYVEGMLPSLAARRATLSTLGLMLAVSAILALYTQSYHSLLRHRQLLGVERALGATRGELASRSVLGQVFLGGAGGLLGALFLGLLSSLLPQLSLSRPPAVVFGLAMFVPIVVLLVLSAVLVFSSLTQSTMTLMRGRVSSVRMLLLLFFVYAGLSLAAAGGLAATQVYLQWRAEAGALQSQFGLIYALQTRPGMIDFRLGRAFESSFDGSAPFAEEDARALEVLEGIAEATLAQTIPSLYVDYARGDTRLTAVVADSSYLDFMGMSLEGNAGGCMLNLGKAQELGISLGQTVRLRDHENPVPCRVSGFFEAPSELWSWLVADLPSLLVPPLSGLNPSANGAESFRSTRILVRLGDAAAEQAVRAWLEEEHPDIQAEVVPYTPDVQELLSGVRVQTRIFLFVAILAAMISLWGIVGGFLTLLDAERFRIALDRALGLPLGQITRSWWWRTLALSAVAAILSFFASTILTARLYNALALEIPNLPEAGLGLNPVLPFMFGMALVVLSAGLTWLAYRRLRRQTPLSLLKGGPAP